MSESTSFPCPEIMDTEDGELAQASVAAWLNASAASSSGSRADGGA
jgi:hypothetical protein